MTSANANANPNETTLKGKKVLVTGADGFIGSHLVEMLVAAGADVRAFCVYNSQGSFGWLDGVSADVKAKLDLRLGDIRDARFCEAACEGIDTVFHLAALIAIPYSYSAPESFVQTNVMGTLNLLEGARRAKVRRFIQTSTSEVYGTPADVPIRETHPMNAQSPYAATKVASDQLSYHLSFEVPVVVLRPFNTFGPRQSTRAVLPTILTQLMEGKKEIQLGRLDPKRDLTYVGDTCAGFLRAAVAPDAVGKQIQLGTGVTVSIGELFDACCEVVGVSAKAVVDPRRLRPEGSEVMILLSDPAYAKEVLGWEPKVSLHDGLRQTADWLQASLAHYNTSYLHV
jgi:NAD dependent epimerase/dehydratase